MHTIKINTTQNVVIEYQIASVGSRILAVFIDRLIFLALMLLNSLLISTFPSDDMFYILSSFSVLFAIFYSVLCEILMDGQTFGKKQMKIKVVRLDGTSPSLGNYLMRWVMTPIDTLIGGGGIGLFVILANGKGQRIGDIAAGTTVISTKPITSPKNIYIEELSPDYQPFYANSYLLSDNDVQIIREIVKFFRESGNDEILGKAADKVAIQLNITSRHTSSNLVFLETILKDHAHQTGKM